MTPEHPRIMLGYVPMEMAERALKDPVADEIDLLVSYPYFAKYWKHHGEMRVRSVSLDSGAYTAKNLGKKIDIEEYIDFCQAQKEINSKLGDIFSLDVIGDWRGGLRNAEYMWKRGVPVIPCYHQGEPEAVLLEIAAQYPKIAVGGVVTGGGPNSRSGAPGPKLRWSQEIFARVWPKKVHGFGFSSTEMMLSLPWHSVDATTWAVAPLCFGRWHYTFDGKQVKNMHWSHKNLVVELRGFVKIQDRVKKRWEKQMQQLEEPPDGGIMSVRPVPVVRGVG